ncbi:MAG: glycosyltransferase [Bryobacteraceae bacterium]|nr:glycosyltransferase [Bryobacteraceae bacterium]
MPHILFTTFGSYGDLHPYLAIALELQRQGCIVTIATSATYRQKVESEGVRFAPVRPDVSLDDREMLAYIFDRMYGSERIIRYVAGIVRATYEDTLPLVRSADAVVTHPLTFAAVAAAEVLRKPWASTVLAPISYLSAYDPPAPAPAPWLADIGRLGPRPMAAVWRFLKNVSLSWLKPLLAFRRELGLDTNLNPLFEGQHSPRLALALFSPVLGKPQPDWPSSVVQTGFPLYDKHHEHQRMPPAVERFLDAGPAPIVFTLGSSAVGAAGPFYRESVEAARRLGARALLLTGTHPQELPLPLPETVATAAYAPHSEVFPRAAAVVHQGGIGTTAQALLSGRPMLVTPFSHDQFDNALRCRRLGVAHSLNQGRYRASRVEPLLRDLMSQRAFEDRAASVQRVLQGEQGAEQAARAILTLL